MSEELNIDSATAMESLQSTTTPEPTPVPLANQQTFSGPGIDEPSGLGVDPTPSFSTTGRHIDSVSLAVSNTRSLSPASEHSSAPGEPQRPRSSFEAVGQTESSFFSALTAPSTTGFEVPEVPDEPNSLSASGEVPSNSPNPQKVRKDDAPQIQSNTTQYVDPNDFEKRFPEDEIGEETGPNARVWRTYLVESEVFDNNMIEEARDGLDALLVFAGLFSGVVTSFVVQTSQSLQRASTDVSASLLLELIAVQRAAASGTPLSSVPPSPLNPSSNFVPKTLDVWVNSLWFISLALNLVVALGAVLVKQWLHRYVARLSGTPKAQCHMRQCRFDGFEQWHVLAIAGWLPVIMHLSLAVFFVGLVLFLLPLQAALSWILAAFAAVVYMLYSITNLLPIVQPQCPYQTPLSDFLCSFLQPLAQRFKDMGQHAHMDDIVSVKALRWLFSASSNPSTRNIVQQAMGGLPVTVMYRIQSQHFDEQCQDILNLLCLNCTQSPSDEYQYYPSPGMERAVERLLRSYTLLRHPAWAVDRQTWSTMLKFNFPDQSNDLRNMLTSVAFNNMDWWAPSVLECLQAILCHNDVPHLASIWMTIVRNSMRIGVFSDFAMNPDLVKQLLPILVWNTSIDQSLGARASIPTASGRYTMAEAINQFMHNGFCNHLETKCNLADEYQPLYQTPETLNEVTPASRALMVTMKVALQQISIGTSTLNERSAHWNNIGYVLGSYRDHNYEMGKDQAVLVSFFHNFVERLIQETDICQSHPLGSEAVLRHRQLVIDIHFETRSGYLVPSPSSRPHPVFNRFKKLLPFHRPSQHIDPPIRESPLSEITSLRRAIEGLLCDIPHNTTIDPNVAYSPILQAISVALQADCVAAYELVAQYNCLDLLHKYKSAEHKHSGARCPRPHLGQQFITGLVNGVVKGTAKTSCIEYLGTNLCKFTILWIAEEACDVVRERLQSVKFPAKGLAGLLSCKDLQDLHPWLSKILTWLKDDRTLNTRSMPELGDESMQEFLKTAFQGIDLFDALQTTRAVIQALAGEENTTESESDSTPDDTNTTLSSHSGANERKRSRFIQRTRGRWGAAQEVSSDVELSLVV